MLKQPATDYHVHVTLPSVTSVPKGWKQTNIVLEHNNQQQHDIMLTKHYRIGIKGITSVASILDDVSASMPFNTVIRVKLEQDSNFTLPVSDTNYIEVHARCTGGSAITLPMWVRSTNPNRQLANGQQQFFFTKRFYSGSIDDIQLEVAQCLESVAVDEVKFEQVILDTNRLHDAWWGDTSKIIESNS